MRRKSLRNNGVPVTIEPGYVGGLANGNGIAVSSDAVVLASSQPNFI